MAIRRSGRPTHILRPPCRAARALLRCRHALLQLSDNWMLQVTTRQPEPGDVVVAARSTECENGFFGELLATSMHARGPTLDDRHRRGGVALAACAGDVVDAARWLLDAPALEAPV